MDDSTKLFVTYTGAATQTYTLTVTTPNGCKGIDNIALTTFPANLASAAPLDTSVCPGATIPIRAKGATVYNWEPNYYLSDSTIANPIASPVSSTTYTLYTFDQNGCRDTDLVNIFIAPNAVMFLGSDTTLYPGQNFTIFPQTNCSNFSWTPATFLSATNVMNPTVTNATNSIQYAVSATTEYGCTTFDTIIITISPQSLIALPNAFSPGNGNTPNDFLQLQHMGTATLNYFRVFNRWGQMVFESNNINDGWNGKFNSTPQPMGTYIYQISAKDNNGKSFEKTGNITLIR